MDDTESVAHTRWDCKYHVVWIPKDRRQALYAELRKYLGPVLRELARQRETVLEEGYLQRDHVHMLISIPRKYAVALVLGDHQGGECYPHCAELSRAAAKLHGPALLGARLLCLHRG